MRTTAPIFKTTLIAAIFLATTAALVSHNPKSVEDSIINVGLIFSPHYSALAYETHSDSHEADFYFNILKEENFSRVHEEVLVHLSRMIDSVEMADKAQEILIPDISSEISTPEFRRIIQFINLICALCKRKVITEDELISFMEADFWSKQGLSKNTIPKFTTERVYRSILLNFFKSIGDNYILLQMDWSQFLSNQFKDEIHIEFLQKHLPSYSISNTPLAKLTAGDREYLYGLGMLYATHSVESGFHLIPDNDPENPIYSRGFSYLEDNIKEAQIRFNSWSNMNQISKDNPIWGHANSFFIGVLKSYNTKKTFPFDEIFNYGQEISKADFLRKEELLTESMGLFLTYLSKGNTGIRPLIARRKLDFVSVPPAELNSAPEELFSRYGEFILVFELLESDELAESLIGWTNSELFNARRIYPFTNNFINIVHFDHSTNSFRWDPYSFFYDFLVW